MSASKAKRLTIKSEVMQVVSEVYADCGMTCTAKLVQLVAKQLYSLVYPGCKCLKGSQAIWLIDKALLLRMHLLAYFGEDIWISVWWEYPIEVSLMEAFPW